MTPHEIIRAKLCGIFRRPTTRLSYLEETLLAEICHSDSAVSEMDEILAYRQRLSAADLAYFPHSITSLLERWNRTLDRARIAPEVRPSKGGPSRADIVALCRAKWGEDPRYANWAVSFWGYWFPRHWQRNGKPIDWQIELESQVQKWRNENNPNRP